MEDDFPLEVTAAALDALRAATARSTNALVRISLVGGGGVGMSFSLGLTKEKADGDVVFALDGINYCLHRDVISDFRGVTLNFDDDAFVFDRSARNETTQKVAK